MQRLWPLLGLIPAILLLLAGCAQGSDLERLVIAAGDGRRLELKVEVARTRAEKVKGLMGRHSLPEDHGMLFVFTEGERAGFWMKDTQIPLSVAFIAADGTIIDIQDMEPYSLEIHNTEKPYRYGLEVNQGWFRRHNVAVGAKVLFEQIKSLRRQH